MQQKNQKETRQNVFRKIIKMTIKKPVHNISQPSQLAPQLLQQLLQLLQQLILFDQFWLLLQRQV